MTYDQIVLEEKYQEAKKQYKQQREERESWKFHNRHKLKNKTEDDGEYLTEEPRPDEPTDVSRDKKSKTLSFNPGQTDAEITPADNIALGKMKDPKKTSILEPGTDLTDVKNITGDDTEKPLTATELAFQKAGHPVKPKRRDFDNAEATAEQLKQHLGHDVNPKDIEKFVATGRVIDPDGTKRVSKELRGEIYKDEKIINFKDKSKAAKEYDYGKKDNKT